MIPTQKLVGNEEERAVSPVIGVILMVAITVILAAVIAAFVLDIGDTGEPVQANLDISNDGDGGIEYTITNVDNVDDIFLRCDGGDVDLIGDNGLASLSVGSTGSIDSGGMSDCGSGSINVIGVADGSESIIKSFDYEGNENGED